MKVQIYADFTDLFSYMGKEDYEMRLLKLQIPPNVFELKVFQLNPGSSTTQSISTVDLLAKKFDETREEIVATKERLFEKANS